MQDTSDIVIIGCGAMGASTAFHLASKGINNITVIEKNSYLGGHTTTRCAGGFRFQFSDKINTELSIKSMDLIKKYDMEEKLLHDYIACGYLFLFSEQYEESMREGLQNQKDMGIHSEWLTKSDIESLLPMVNLENITSGTFYSNDGLINVSSLINFYINRARSKGVKFYTGTEVIGMEQEGNKIVTVKTSKGNIKCGTVINAAGPWAANIAKMIHIDLPIQPVMQQLFVTDSVKWVSKEFPVVIFIDDKLGVHQEGTGIISGLTRPDNKNGFSDNRLDKSWEVLQCKKLLKRFPSLKKARIMSHWYGYYENTPDDYPIIGKLDEADNFYCIAGFSGHGIMHSPIAGLLLSEYILDNRTKSGNIAPFNYHRFDKTGIGRKELYKI